MKKNPSLRQKYNIHFHGKAKYGKDWPKIRARIVRRDGGRCKICEEKKGLHVHHIIPFKISHSNEDLNLVTLCRKCHPKVEKVAWMMLQEGAHRYQIYKAAWGYINNERQKLLLERK